MHLNVVRSIRVILDAMAEAQAYHATTYSGPNTPVRTHAPDLFQSPSSSYASLGRPPPPLTAEHLKLKLRLAPLVQVEETLVRKLTQAGSGEMEATQLQMLGGNASHADRARALDREVAVNSQFAWKGVFHKMIGRSSMDSETDFNDPDVSARAGSGRCGNTHTGIGCLPGPRPYPVRMRGRHGDAVERPPDQVPVARAGHPPRGHARLVRCPLRLP